MNAASDSPGPLRTVQAVRYVTPLREGGSMPAIVEADDLGTYVLKFRGAGQGAKVLVAEVVAAGIARALGLPVPELVLMQLDPALGQNEPDSEIRALIKASAGLNLALDYLPGSLTYEPGLLPLDRGLAARITWFDALVINVDRTVRNTNMLLWHRQLYLIDHGASLYVHHDWPEGMQKGRAPFPQIRQHVLAPQAGDLTDVDQDLADRLSPDLLSAILDQVPDAWLPAPAADSRALYLRYLRERLTAPRPFLSELSHAPP
jgi:hypothetical protein